jgi:hypothetical protein
VYGFPRAARKTIHESPNTLLPLAKSVALQRQIRQLRFLYEYFKIA